jgi:hypothetical protein
MYPVTALPPFSAGGAHETSSEPPRASTDVINGVPGGCAASGTTGAEAGDAAEEPAAFRAFAVAV